MSVPVYDVSVAVFTRMLKSLAGLLDKAALHAEAKKLDPRVLVEARLFPDMFPLARQVQIACDFAKGCTARLAGLEPPKFDDSEQTLDELQARVAKTLDFIASVRPQQLEGSESRTIVHPLRTITVTLPGLKYLTGFAMPNFYFHLTTAYAILRHNGVELGKKDFVGPLE